jgi:hypothetical protein
MSVVISRLYQTVTAARGAIEELEAAGLRRDQTIIARNGDKYLSAGERSDTARTRFALPAQDGTDRQRREPNILGDVIAVVGGVALIAAGLATLAVPGLGAIVVGGIVGALAQRSTGEDDEHAEGVRRGDTLLTVSVPEADRARYEAILDRV